MTLTVTALVLTAAALADVPTRVGHQGAQPKSHAPKLDGTVLLGTSSIYVSEPGCLPSVKAITYYRKAYTLSRNRMNLHGAVNRVWYQHCPALRARAAAWRDKAKAAHAALTEWQRDQYAWWRWMPRDSKWYRVASCETGYGRDPNFAHDSGTYVSAFGIYRAGYADDAHRVGNLSWDETIRARGSVPTPREQYEAALSHYNAHGGFSGWGCRGA